MRTLFIISTLLSFVASEAYGQFHFSGNSHRGGGCPRDTVSFSESPDGQSVSVLFDNFMVQLPDPDMGQIPGSTIRRRYDPTRSTKGCNISFSVELEPGHMIEALEISVFNRGATYLDPGIAASLSTKFLGYSAFGSRGAPQAVNIEAKQWGSRGVAEDWISNPVITLPIRSACSSSRGARDIRFDMLSTLDAQIVNGNLNASGLVTMDSSDVNGGMKIRVISRRCSGRVAPVYVPQRRIRRGREPR